MFTQANELAVNASKSSLSLSAGGTDSTLWLHEWEEQVVLLDWSPINSKVRINTVFTYFQCDFSHCIYLSLMRNLTRLMIIAVPWASGGSRAVRIRRVAG